MERDNSDRNRDSNPTRNRNRALTGSYQRLLKTYVECGMAPLLKSARYGEDTQPGVTRSPNSPSSNFVCDTEIMVRRTLKDPKLLDEWDARVQEAITGTDPAPNTELTNRMIQAVGQAAARRGLDLSYFKTVRRSA
jgi:hypothetical protein